MLVLSRKVGERIAIGKDVVIILVAIKGECAVRIGIDAPCHMNIVRQELLNRATTTPHVSEFTSNPGFDPISMGM